MKIVTCSDYAGERAFIRIDADMSEQKTRDTIESVQLATSQADAILFCLPVLFASAEVRNRFESGLHRYVEAIHNNPGLTRILFGMTKCELISLDTRLGRLLFRKCARVIMHATILVGS